MQEKMIPIAASKRPIMSDVKLLKKSGPDQCIRVSIYLRQNTKPNAEAMARLESLNTELPGNRRYLNEEEFNSAFGADEADLDNARCMSKMVPSTIILRLGMLESMTFRLLSPAHLAT
jgi:hypothetical protein